ncbi:hypothetical protein QE152_g9541 [Popillia japonica]|uniref:Uncharacterized protein n=1 Tax=Popillia japonica TaxID=7064 RepID=A0AAW1LUD2_POPJA
MQQLFKEGTRITPTTNTCIDNVFTNYTGHITAQILHSNLSDHTAQQVCWRTYPSNLSDHTAQQVCWRTYPKRGIKFSYRRVINERTIETFKEALQSMDWQDANLSDHTAQQVCWRTYPKRGIKFSYRRVINERTIETIKFSYRRVINERTIETFKEALQSMDWQDVYTYDVNVAYECFIDTLKTLFWLCFPLRRFALNSTDQLKITGQSPFYRQYLSY